MASVEALRSEDFEITNILGEQAALFRHCQIQYLRIGKPSALGAFDDGDDIVSPFTKSLSEQGREHLVQQKSAAHDASSPCSRLQRSSASSAAASAAAICASISSG